MSILDDGTRLGRYLIVRHLGSGGMADVYEAEDSQLGRRVALKVLPPELARNPQFIQRFESEVRKAASLNHGGIVPVFDFGFENGTHYYSMRLLTHGSLRNRINDGLSDGEALSILRDIADALGHAHSRQPPLVHRDVKPENILFDEQGHALLTDFGIAKAMDGNHSLTATGVAIGSALYMSPEQARGKKDVDGRADLYSLGAMFHEMLMGVPPYDGEDQISIILKHVTEPIPQLPDKFAQYQSLLDAMMAKNPAQRVASARDLVDLIEPLLPSRPTRGAAGARTTGQTQTAAFLAASGAEAAAQAADAEQRQREERDAATRKAAEEAEAKRKAEAEQAAQHAAEQQRLAAAAEAARKADEARARSAAEAAAAAERRKAEAEAQRQRSEAERVAAEKAAAQKAIEQKAAEQQRLRDEQAQEARRHAEERVRAEAQARRQAEQEARRLQDEAEALFEREMAAAMEAEQQRLTTEQQAAARKAADERARREAQQKAEAERIERDRAAELKGQQDAQAKQKADDETRRQQQAEAQRLAREQAAEAQRQREAEAAARRTEPPTRVIDDDATVVRRIPERPAPRPPREDTVRPSTPVPDLHAPKRTPAESASKRPPPAPAPVPAGASVVDPGLRGVRAMPRQQLQMAAAAGGLLLLVVVGLLWRSGGGDVDAQVAAAFANPAEALPAATFEQFQTLDEAERNVLLAADGAVERYFLARSQAAFSVDPLSDDRVAALTLLRKANQELYARPNQALAERVDALSEPLYELLDMVDGKTLFSLDAEQPSVLQVLRQLVLAGDEKRLEKRFRSELLRRFDAALAAASKQDLPGYERLLGDLEIVYGADQARREALQSRLDAVGELSPPATTPSARADDYKALSSAEQAVDAALAANKLDLARSEVLKLRKTGTLGSDRGKALADKVARRFAEQAKGEIESASMLKESSAAFELKAALLASVRQLSPRVDIGALQATQRAKAELIAGRELAGQILAGAAPSGDAAAQAGINLELALRQIDAAPKPEREPLKTRLTQALDTLRAAPDASAIAKTTPVVAEPTTPAEPLSGNDPCTGQKACSDVVGGQTLRSYRLGASAPYDRLFLLEQEVSVALYSIVMGTSMAASPRLPITGISADDARRFADKLSAQTRHRFRLPTAAEWQLAAKEIRPNVLATANCANGGGRLNNVEKPIGQAKGAVNIIGNAAEIVADGGKLQVAGASFRDSGADCSPDSLKAYSGPDAGTGFRLVRVVE